MNIQQDHPQASFVLDIIDKAIKGIAVLIGGLWTWWNYRKSRTYQQKLELEVNGATYSGTALYGDIQVSVKNIGATTTWSAITARFVRFLSFETTYRKSLYGSSRSLKRVKESNPESRSTMFVFGR